MIAPAVVEEIRRLLQEEKWSQRTIARRTGVSRGTVNAICLGKRPDPKPPRSDFTALALPSGPTERCPSCGRKVQMPCLACRVLSWRETRRRSQELGI